MSRSALSALSDLFDSFVGAPWLETAAEVREAARRLRGAIARLDEDLISLQQEGCDLSVTAAQRSMAAIGPVGAEHWWWWFDPPCYVSGGCPLIPR